MRPIHRSCVPLLLVLGAACGGGVEPVGPPTAVVAIDPGPFTGTVGEALATPLRVRVTAADGRAVPGTAVRFAVTSGGGTVQLGTLGGASLTDTTDQDGAAEAQWTLGTVAGAQGASAAVDGVGTVTFTATAEAGPAAVSIILEASAFIARVSSPTDEPLAVRVEDQYHNAVAGAVVNWTALTAGASVGAASTTSSADGIAQVGATLGAAPGFYLFGVQPVGLPTDTIGVIAVTAVADPVGDQAPIADPAYASHDATHFGAVVIADVLVLYARFAAPISANSATSGRTAMTANYDLDVDGDSLTGYLTLRQCAGGDPLGFGTDAFVDLDPQSLYLSGQTGIPTGSVAVLRVDSLLGDDRCASSFNGSLLAAVPAYQPTTVSLVIPLAFLEDDGAVGFTHLFLHPATGVTDILPDSAAWDFVPTVVAGAPGAGSADPWSFLSVPRPAGRAVRVEGMPLMRRRLGR